jgi:hypothetical protein
MALVILVTAREHDAQYEWTVNELVAQKAGLESSIVDIVRDRKSSTGLGEKEMVLIEFARELFGKHNVSSATYARALKMFGERDLVDLVSVMAQHSAGWCIGHRVRSTPARRPEAAIADTLNELLITPARSIRRRCRLPWRCPSSSDPCPCPV